MTLSLQNKAGAFSRLHDTGCFVLPNVWDVASALLAADAGFAAVGTTSAGVALARGLADGEHIGRDRMIAIASEIATRVPVPVTVDLEAGYGPAPEDVAISVRAAIAGGLVGCNIEDTDPRSHELFDFDLGVSRIRAGARAAREAGLPDFVLNARIDPFLTGFGAPEECTREAIRRANAYLKAGARSVFVPGPVDAATLGALAKGIEGPLNAWGGVGDRLLPLDQLSDLGIRRVSLGAGPMLATYSFAKQAFQSAVAGRSLEFAGAGRMFGELTSLAQRNGL